MSKTTSGSYDFELTRNKLITESLRKLGAVATGQNPTAAQLSEGAEALNVLVKALQDDNVMLWTREWKTKTFTASSEVTGTDGNIYTCTRSHTATADNRPVTGAEYLSYWKQGGTTGGVWAVDTEYSSIGDWQEDADTVLIEAANIRSTTSHDYPVSIITFDEYFKIDNKFDASSYPDKLAFHRKLIPHVYLYPQPNNTDFVLEYMRVRLLEDFDTSTNNPDFPVRWYKYLVFALAADLAYEYGVDPRLYEMKATKLKKQAKDGDRPITNNHFKKGAFNIGRTRR